MVESTGFDAAVSFPDTHAAADPDRPAYILGDSAARALFTSDVHLESAADAAELLHRIWHVDADSIYLSPAPLYHAAPRDRQALQAVAAGTLCPHGRGRVVTAVARRRPAEPSA